MEPGSNVIKLTQQFLVKIEIVKNGIRYSIGIPPHSHAVAVSAAAGSSLVGLPL